MPSKQLTEWTYNVHDFSPEPGDLIEFDRGTYCHWGLYIGNEEIVHFRPDSLQDKTGVLDMEKFVPGLIETRSLLHVQCQYFQENPESAAQEPSKMRVNNKAELDKTPRTADNILRLVEVVLEEPRTIEYCLGRFNCEHFVKFLKFGVIHSKQMSKIKKSVYWVILSFLFPPFLTSSYGLWSIIKGNWKMKRIEAKLNRMVRRANLH